MSMRHYDGSDVIVLNEHGLQLREIDEVCIEYDRAIVHVRAQSNDARFAPASSFNDDRLLSFPRVTGGSTSLVPFASSVFESSC